MYMQTKIFFKICKNLPISHSPCFIIAYLYLINANIELPPMAKRILCIQSWHLGITITTASLRNI